MGRKEAAEDRLLGGDVRIPSPEERGAVSGKRDRNLDAEKGSPDLHQRRVNRGLFRNTESKWDGRIGKKRRENFGRVLSGSGKAKRRLDDICN